jgi:hypothetical protein
MTYVQERAVAGALAVASPPAQQSASQAIGTSRAPMLRVPDSIRRVLPQPVNGMPVIGGGTNSIIQQLLGIIQQLLSALGLAGFGGNILNGAQGNEQFFQNASGASVGDPHLSFNGTTSNGAADSTRFDNMNSHGDLLDSDSFSGGYQISTNVTQPGANGVTFNQSATITTGFGGTRVSLDKNGNATIVQNGQSIALVNGQSYDLGDGETVARDGNGSVVVTDNNGMGGTITTTLSENGQGVNVNAQASNVDLGGDLLHQPNTPRYHRDHHPVNYELA